MDLPQSVQETHALLARGNYIAERSLATALYLSLSLKRPLFLEGEATFLLFSKMMMMMTLMMMIFSTQIRTNKEFPLSEAK